MRRSACRLFLQGFKLGQDSNIFTNLWNKPETKDSRVKEYVPEVLEESLAEQRAVLQESTSRDVIVGLGHKVLQGIENKAPTPSLAPNLNKILIEYGAKDVIAQRPLSYLLYPNSSLSPDEQPHELVSSFQDNLRTLIESVESHGCSVRETAPSDAPPAGGVSPTVTGAAPRVGAEDGAAHLPAGGEVIVASKSEHEPMDVTMFIKVVSGMALANMHCGDLRNAVRCVDCGIAHAVDQQRLGGLLGLKAGLLIHQNKYEEAADSARLAIEASHNIQGYLQGAYALRRLGRNEEVIALLEDAQEHHPMNTAITNQLDLVRKDTKLSLPAGSSEDGKNTLSEQKVIEDS
ncbi:hypothetical protein STCU_03532 [Strigomonas culicis]|nr:hypothetical protein STCU_03532 [Strigomonas culicis]|eukprot:EPY31286.1 hypothetical protein STCU_03532 [Strigomonas culicis]